MFIAFRVSAYFVAICNPSLCKLNAFLWWHFTFLPARANWPWPWVLHL